VFVIWVMWLAIVKLSSSKKAVLFVLTEDAPRGTVFMTSLYSVNGVLNGSSPTGFNLLTMLPSPIDVSRFKPSPLLGQSGGPVVYGGREYFREKEDLVVFGDKVVDL
jgi:hypothetical protein